MYKKLFTSESVGAGHPDKICDQISDEILDRILKKDKEARVAVEVMASNKLIVVAGEITTKAYVDVVKATWDILFTLGYSEGDFIIISNVNSQSKDISQGVNKKLGNIGAGDQGIMFGYAIDETPELMPLPITMAHNLVERAEKLRLNKKFKWAKSDMKSQVTIDYSNDKPKIHTMLMSIQHDEKYKKDEFYNFIKKEIMEYVAKKYHLNINFKVHINSTGKFVIGGPSGDTGLTGRKNIVDTYGGMGRHGGGALSGKDYTKADRFATYAARWVAKHIVQAKIATQAEIQLSYAIGISKPISIAVDCGGTEIISINKIEYAIKKVFDLSPKGIIKSLKLKRPIYAQTAKFGHFGRPNLYLPWEQTNKINEFKKALNV